MILTNSEVKERIKAPRNLVAIERARFQESRLRYHAQIAEQQAYASTYHNNFLGWVSSILTAKDKYAQFCNQLQFPLVTNDIVDTIADEYAKVFNSQDSYIGYTFTDSAKKQDFAEYLESQKDDEFWHKPVFSAMLSAINSIVVIDLERQQRDNLPEPYQYLLSFERVIDVHTDNDGKIEYLIFKQDYDRIVVLDDARYAVFKKNGEEYRQEFVSPHELGYTPAAFMWHDSISPRDQIIKQSPISSVLSRLDWFLFVAVSKQCLDIYASFPIYWQYKSKCKQEGCNDGWRKHTYPNGDTALTPCPACASNKLTGAGTLVEVPPPRDNQSPDLRDPVGIVGAPTDSLKYNVDEVERIEANIIEVATGKLQEKYRTTGAINEDQVHSNYESQTNILAYIASNFEIIRKWSVDTRAKLRYGDSYLGCTINYGRDFYLQTQDSITEEYKVAKDAGLPMYILQAKRNQVDELQAKNNPTEKERLIILRNLEPYQDISIGELQTFGIPDKEPEKFAIKLNFAMFVNRFELEYGNIVEWGSALSFKTKIDRINQVFLKYVKETQTTSASGANTAA